MKLISTYRDLLGEIDVYKSRLEDLEREFYALGKIRHTHKITLDRYTERYNKIESEIAILAGIIEDKEQSQREILEKINQLEGLEYKIAYKRFIEGRTHNEIAEELGYSHDHIRRVYSKSKICHKDDTYIEKTI